MVDRHSYPKWLLYCTCKLKYGVHVALVEKRWVYANKECTLNKMTLFTMLEIIKSEIILCTQWQMDFNCSVSVTLIS